MIIQLCQGFIFDLERTGRFREVFEGVAQLKTLHRREGILPLRLWTHASKRTYSLNNNILKTVPVTIFVSMGFLNKLWHEAVVYTLPDHP